MAGSDESTPGAPIKHSFQSFNVDAVRALMPRRPIVTKRGVPVEFELNHITLKNLTPAQLNVACEAVENRPEFSQLTIIPPDAGDTWFHVEVEGEGLVTIDLPALKKALIEALEAML